jgi:hypothetical protein
MTLDELNELHRYYKENMPGYAGLGFEEDGKKYALMVMSQWEKDEEYRKTKK